MITYIAFGAASLAVGLGLGYTVANKQARRGKSRLLQQFNAQSLELLEAKSSLNDLQNFAKNHSRKERLLKLTMVKLQESNRDIKALKLQQAAREKTAFIELSKVRQQAVKARDVASRATKVARKFAIHLKRVELASPATQTIEAPPPKSYGAGKPVTVSVVDQGKLDGTAESVAKVTNRDSARLSKLHSSNEVTALR